MRLITEILTNDNGRYSTTNFIQVLAAIALCIGFFIALILDKNAVETIIVALASMAIATPVSKGIINRNRGDNEH